jgi:molecular chaperone GrpE
MEVLTSEQESEREGIVDKRAASRMEKDDEDVTPGEAEEREAPEAPAANGGGDMSQQLAEEREKAEQYYRNWQRSAADFVNYKRRVEQERGELARFANAAMVINILPVFDDLERAVETVDAHMAGLNWVQGVVAIHRKFANLLEAMGVAEIPAAGETFDPAIHEAVARQPGAENTVLHVVQKGYRLGEKVVRPAMVIVGEGDKE